MGLKAIPQGEIVVDDRGRTSLARVRDGRYTRYRAEENAEGVITLTPVSSHLANAVTLAITMLPAQLSDIERAREALKAGDAATAAYLLGVPREDVERVAGPGSS
jgi:hypothetical protein